VFIPFNMLRCYKIILIGLFFCHGVFISCRSKSQSQGNTTAFSIDPNDTILNKFKHFFGDSLPKPKSYVNDYTYLFTPEQAESLNILLSDFEKKTTNQIAVVSFDTTMVSKQDFDALTLKLANAWGVGQKDKNNGILIGICAGYKKMRIQNGLGIEKILSDPATKQIVDSDFIPFFKQGEYFIGTLNGINTIIKKLGQGQQ